MKILKIVGMLVAISLLALGVGAVFYPEVDPVKIMVKNQSIVGLIIGGLVAVIVAGALFPVVFNQTDTLEANLTAEGHDTESTLVGLWPLLLVIGVMVAIIGFAL